MKNPEQRPVETMSLEACQDELARADGWESDNIWWHRGQRGTLDCEYAQDYEHPVPATLDAIAAAMPEGWYLLQLNWSADHGFNACGGKGDPRRKWAEFRDANADTEILARARLAVACHRAAHEARKGNGGA